MGAFVYRVLGEGGLLELVSLSFQNRHRESVVLWLSTPWNKRNKNYSSRTRDTRLSRQPIILELPFVCREEEPVRVKTASRAAGRKWNQVPAPPKPFKVFVALAGEVPLQWRQAATSEVEGWGGRVDWKDYLELDSSVLSCSQTGMLGQKKIGSELGGDWLPGREKRMWPQGWGLQVTL